MSSNDLAIAAYRGDASAVRNLLTAYPEAINQKHTVWGRTPLMYACASGHLAIVQMLLEARPMLDVQDKFGETALMTAAESGLDAIVALLLNNGADANVKDASGRRAIDKAKAPSVLALLGEVFFIIVSIRVYYRYFHVENVKFC